MIGNESQPLPDPELWLADRLKQHGVDIYAGGEFASFRDRLARAIITNKFGTVIAGRHEKKPESYGELFERIYGIKLNDVPRGT